jgi:hypothetical protein
MSSEARRCQYIGVLPRRALSASALASKSRAAGPSVVSHFSLMRGGRHRAHRTETSRLMFSMLAKGKQGVTKINSASVRGSRHVDARHAAGLGSEPIQSPRRAVASHILAVGSDRSVFPPGEELEIVGFVPCATMTNDNGANCSRPRRCTSFTSSLSTLAQPIARGRVSALPK